MGVIKFQPGNLLMSKSVKKAAIRQANKLVHKKGITKKRSINTLSKIVLRKYFQGNKLCQ